MKETEGGTTKEYTWIGGDAYSAPVVAVKEGSTTSYYYLLRDYLGNITHQVNTANSVVAEYNFDPWGRRRDKDSWSYTLSSEPRLFADRGFTGHEHLEWFKLINMNGRLYDPVVGRFLSPDENVQMPDFSQNFNRYTYALNNPLVYVDEDGEFIFLAFAAAFVVGAAIDYGLQVAANYAAGYKGKDAWFRKVDFFDVAISGGISGLTAGYGASINAGMKVGKFGNFLYKNKNLVKLGEIGLTSGVDITGEGWQPVALDDFGKRVAIGAGTHYGTKLVTKAFKGKTPSIEENFDGSKPASTPIGRRGNPLEVKPGTNLPSTIGGRNYTGHALDQMQSRGIMPSAVEDAIKNSLKITPGNTPGTFVRFGDGLKVIINNSGDVITVIPQ